MVGRVAPPLGCLELLSVAKNSCGVYAPYCTFKCVYFDAGIYCCHAHASFVSPVDVYFLNIMKNVFGCLNHFVVLVLKTCEVVDLFVSCHHDFVAAVSGCRPVSKLFV